MDNRVRVAANLVRQTCLIGEIGKVEAATGGQALVDRQDLDEIGKVLNGL